MRTRRNQDLYEKQPTPGSEESDGTGTHTEPERSGEQVYRLGRLALPGRSNTKAAGGAAGKRRGIRRLFTWKKALVFVITLAALLGGGFTALYLAIDIPRANEQAQAQSNVYLFSDGTRLARTGEINRETVPLSTVPEDVQQAFVAAENKDFYSDSGVSLSGTARGIISTLTGKGKQGGSTITQQYVKTYYLSQEQTVTRKVKELVISLKVDRRNTKDDILAGYLNTSYYGRLAYGVQAASRAYFHRDVQDLSVEQGAYLAALLQAPSQYDWAVAGPEGRKRVTARWNYVLDNMVGQGWLDKGKRQQMKFPVPVPRKTAPGLSGRTGYLLDAALQELIASGVSEQELAGGGWRITLSLDPRKQKALEQAVETRLDERRDDSDDEGQDGSEGEEEDGSEGGDGGDGAGRQVGAVSLDPRSGRIVALYGGRDYTRHYISNATRSDYQAGPAFEPVAMAASMEAETAPTDVFGTQDIKKTANALGMHRLTERDLAGPAASLGLMGASPMELASVYSSFHNEGRKVTPSIVKSAVRDGTPARLPQAIGGQAVARQTADDVISYLEGSTGRQQWTGRTYTGDGEIVVMNSSRSDDRKAEWFIGSAGNLLTTIGLFGEDAVTQKQVTLKNIGDGTPADIWSRYTGRSLYERSPTLAPGEAAHGPGLR